MQRPWWILSPHMPAVQRWEIVIAVAMIFVCSVTPYEVSVMRGDPGTVLNCMNYLIDGIFAVGSESDRDRNRRARGVGLGVGARGAGLVLLVRPLKLRTFAPLPVRDNTTEAASPEGAARSRK